MLAYVQLLGSAVDVSVSKGVLTALLRRRWGLNPLLGGGEKNRADHRHHAVDAAVIACVNRSLYQKLVKLMREPGTRLERIALDAPFAHYRDSLAAHLDRLCVSHAPLRKLSGALHEETAYGLRRMHDGSMCIVYRKQLAINSQTLKLNNLVDDGLRRQLQEHLARFGGNLKLAFSENNLPVLHAGCAPIRHARFFSGKYKKKYNVSVFLSLNNQHGSVSKHFPYDNNHHVEILRDCASGKVNGVFVTMWEAAQRAHRHKQPMVQTNHGPDKVFLMALHIGDMVALKKNNKKSIYRVQNLDSSNQKISLLCQYAASSKADSALIHTTVAKLMRAYEMTPLRINVLGKPLP